MFVNDPGAAKLVTRRSTKHVHKIIAYRTLLPPYVVYKAKHTYAGWTEAGAEGTLYNRTMSG